MFRIATLAAATLLAFAAYRSSRRGKALDPAPAAPAPLQTWEGEGGGVPASATRTVAQLPVRDEENPPAGAPASGPLQGGGSAPPLP